MSSRTRHPREELQRIIEEDKPTYVRSLFDSIAKDYDRMNWIMTGGLLALWHRTFARETALAPGQTALDVCCGTGDLSFIAAKRVGPTGKVVGVDFSESMLEIARQRDAKSRSTGTDRLAPITWMQGDALNLELPDGGEDSGFHCTSMGFALRNVGDLPRSIAEMSRVTRRGGRVVCLEVSRPANGLIRAGFQVYFYRIVPFLGQMAERGLPDGSPLKRLRPYTYLPYSLEHLPPSDEIVTMMRDAGLKSVRCRPLTGGIVSLYIGEKG